MHGGPSGGSVVYLYGIVPSGQAVPPRDGSEVAHVALPSVVAVADLLPAEGFTGAALESRLQDIEWISAQARLHTTVLGQAMEHGPVVPAHLCTLFSSTGALRDFLEKNEIRLQETLERLRGRREWGLKLYCDESRVRAKCLADDPELSSQPDAGTAGTGASWMLRKRRDALLSDRLSERIEQAAQAVLDELGGSAADVRVRPALTEAASGVAQPMILNAALLVDVDAEAALHDAVATLGGTLEDDGYHLVLSGPWPPFSFSEEEPS
ncbi:MAG: GvpL/GvpF family gas vesicle protein [Deltaproteobacteria bacterium]